MRLLVNVFSRDIAAQAAFYARVLGAEEARAKRSAIYRAVVVGGSELGFNAAPAYALLGLAARQPSDGATPTTVAYPTFELDSPAGVDAALGRVEEAGGAVVKPAFATYYGQWQAVAADPEQNVFRLAAPSLPTGVVPPRLDALLTS